MFQELYPRLLAFISGAFQSVPEVARAPLRAPYQIDVNLPAMVVQLPKALALRALHVRLYEQLYRQRNNSIVGYRASYLWGIGVWPCQAGSAETEAFSTRSKVNCDLCDVLGCKCGG